MEGKMECNSSYCIKTFQNDYDDDDDDDDDLQLSSSYHLSYDKKLLKNMFSSASLPLQPTFC